MIVPRVAVKWHRFVTGRQSWAVQINWGGGRETTVGCASREQAFQELAKWRRFARLRHGKV